MFLDGEEGVKPSEDNSKGVARLEAELKQMRAEKEAAIDEKEKAIDEKEKAIDEKEKAIAKKDEAIAALAEKEVELAAVRRGEDVPAPQAGAGHRVAGDDDGVLHGRPPAARVGAARGRAVVAGVDDHELREGRRLAGLAAHLPGGPEESNGAGVVWGSPAFCRTLRAGGRVPRATRATLWWQGIWFLSALPCASMLPL